LRVGFGLDFCEAQLTVVDLDKQPKIRSRRPHRARTQLLSRAQLDGRSNIAKMFDRMVTDVENDLGGQSELSTIERQLVEAFVGSALIVHHLNARLLTLDDGGDIDLAAHAAAGSLLVKIATRLGLKRRQRELMPTLNEYLRAKQRSTG